MNHLLWLTRRKLLETFSAADTDNGHNFAKVLLTLSYTILGLTPRTLKHEQGPQETRFNTHKLTHKRTPKHSQAHPSGNVITHLHSHNQTHTPTHSLTQADTHTHTFTPKYTYTLFITPLTLYVIATKRPKTG